MDQANFLDITLKYDSQKKEKIELYQNKKVLLCDTTKKKKMNHRKFYIYKYL